MTAPSPAPDPRQRRQRHLGTYLSASAGLCFLLSVAALVVGGSAASSVATVAVAAAVVAPLSRVAWLTVRWLRLGDRRFAAAGLMLLALAVLAAALS